MALWYDFEKNLKMTRKTEKTIKDYKFSLNKFFNYSLEKNIEDVTLDDFLDMQYLDYKNYMSYMVDAGLSSNTIKVRFFPIKTLYNYLQNEDLIPIEKNLTNKISKLINSITHKQVMKKNVITKDTIQKLYESILTDNTNEYRFRNLLIVKLMLQLGLRISEVQGIKVSNFDLENKILLIENTKNHDDKELPISDDLKLIFLKYMETRSDNNSEYLLISQKNIQQITTEGIRDAFKREIQRYNTLYNTNLELKPHDCRRTFATTLAANSIDILTISRLLGHRNLNTTRIYVQNNIENKKQALEKIEYTFS